MIAPWEIDDAPAAVAIRTPGVVLGGDVDNVATVLADLHFDPFGRGISKGLRVINVEFDLRPTSDRSVIGLDVWEAWRLRYPLPRLEQIRSRMSSRLQLRGKRVVGHLPISVGRRMRPDVPGWQTPMFWIEIGEGEESGRCWLGNDFLEFGSLELLDGSHCFVPLPEYIRGGIEVVSPTRLLLERFDGFVDAIRDETAYLTLVAPDGEKLLAEYPANELAAAGIKEHRHLVCETVLIDGEVNVEMTPINENHISREEQREMWQEIEHLATELPQHDDDDDGK